MFFKPGKEKEKLNSIDYDYHPTRFNHFLSLEKWSRWYFNKHIVPAQQNELSKEKLLKEMNSEAKRKSQLEYKVRNIRRIFFQHYTDLRCTIHQTAVGSYVKSRSCRRVAPSITHLAISSISASLLFIPSVIRKLLAASSLLCPYACKTLDGLF